MKTVLLVLAKALAFGWRLMPDRLRLGGITGLLVLESRHSEPAMGLRAFCSFATDSTGLSASEGWRMAEGSTRSIG